MKSSSLRTGLRSTARQKLESPGYHQHLVSLLWTEPVQISLRLAKLNL